MSQRDEILSQLDNRYYDKSYFNKIFYHFNRNKFRYFTAMVCSLLLIFTLPVMKDAANKNIREVKVSEERGKIFDREGNELVYSRSSNGSSSKQNDFLIDILGITDKDGNGLAGIEKQYDDDLRNGKNLTLTVDSSIQDFVEKYAEITLKDNKARGVTIIVMNPKNGEVIAMANKSDHNTSNTIKASDEMGSTIRNRSVSDTFAPGSMFKVITASAAMAEGLIKENEEFVCDGSTRVSDRTIKCWNTQGHGEQNFEELLQNSCSVGFVELAERLGAVKLNQYMESFGLGQKTGIDLPEEVSGTLGKIENISELESATMALGLNNTVSSIQFLAAFNAIANQGEWVRPHFMKQIETQNSQSKKVIQKDYNDFSKRKVLDTNTAKLLCEYLRKVISEGGGNKAYIKGYDIAGIAGTAQKLNKDLGIYEGGKYISSFVGMAPANDAKVTVYVSIDEPDPDNYYAGQIAAVVGKEVFQYILSNY